MVRAIILCLILISCHRKTEIEECIDTSRSIAESGREYKKLKQKCIDKYYDSPMIKCIKTAEQNTDGPEQRRKHKQQCLDKWYY